MVTVLKDQWHRFPCRGEPMPRCSLERVRTMYGQVNYLLTSAPAKMYRITS